ncbi:MAG: hypothetical protein RIN55_04460 [Tissierellaceae bacterium]|nr:hypothetical protein [Tissierellaceae bacterium]
MLVAKAELNYYPEQFNEQEYEKVRKNKKNIKDSKKNNKYKVLIKLACIFIAIMILSTSLFILFRYARITNIRMEVTELERHKIELEKSKLNLLADIERVKSSSNISEDAMYKLGMSYPKEGQVIYLSLGEPVEEVIESVGLSEKLNNVLTMFSGLF